MPGNIFTEILTWSKQLAPWQNEAIRRLFKNGDLLPNDKEEIFRQALIEHGFLPALPGLDLMLMSSDLPPPPLPGQKIKLKGLREVTYVNALKANEHLSIGEQLTVIYGDNASGKSGYARIMKKAFRARVVDPVLPNVYVATPKNPATAVFEIEENGQIRDEKWIDGQQSPDCLGRFAVFDGKCARVYISENNELGFLPYGFDIINGLGAVTADVKRRFHDLARNTAPKPDALKMFVDGTATGQFIASISPATKEDDIKARGVWTNSDSALLAAKEEELAKFKANSPNNLRNALSGRRRQVVAVRDLVARMAQALSPETFDDIQINVENLANLEKAVEAAAKATFGDLVVPGIGGDVWRELLIAAAKFSTTVAFPSQPFPAARTGSICVLCLQSLDTLAQERLNQFWSFIQDDVSSKRDAARAALDLKLEALSQLPRQLPPELQMLEETFRAAGCTIFDEAKSFYELSFERINALETAIATEAWDVIPPTPLSPVHTCEVEIAAIDKQLGAIVDDTKIASSIALLTTEVAELNARKCLHTNLSHVSDHHEALMAWSAEFVGRFLWFGEPS